MVFISISKEYLRRIFKHHTGYPPLAYLTNRRMEYAKELLKNVKTGLMIKEIAEMAGYNDPYYFSRLFRKLFGKSPRAWINRS